MSMLNTVFYDNGLLSDLLIDSKEESNFLVKIASLQSKIEKLTTDSEIIETVNKIIELNDKYYLMKCFDSFKLGISFALELISESNKFN